MERNSIEELSRLYDEGKIPTLQYIRSLEAQVRLGGGLIPGTSMSDNERIAVARDYLSAKGARDDAEEQLAAAAAVSYPTNANEAQNLTLHLTNIRAAQRRMNDCLEKLS